MVIFGNITSTCKFHRIFSLSCKLDYKLSVMLDLRNHTILILMIDHLTLIIQHMQFLVLSPTAQ